MRDKATGPGVSSLFALWHAPRLCQLVGSVQLLVASARLLAGQWPALPVTLGFICHSSFAPAGLHRGRLLLLTQTAQTSNIVLRGLFRALLPNVGAAAARPVGIEGASAYSDID